MKDYSWLVPGQKIEDYPEKMLDLYPGKLIDDNFLRIEDGIGNKIKLFMLNNVHIIFTCDNFPHRYNFFDQHFNPIALPYDPCHKIKYELPLNINNLSSIKNRTINIDRGFIAFDRFCCNSNMCHETFDHGPRALHWILNGYDESDIYFSNASWNWSKYIFNNLFPKSNYLNPNTFYFFDKLYYTTHIPMMGLHPVIQYSCDYVKSLKKFINSVCKKDSSYPEIIFQSRLDSSRRFKNEESINKKFLENGIVPIVMSKLSIVEQLNYFYNAKIIIAHHGAGLTNMIACRPGTHIYEFCCKDRQELWAYSTVAPYFNLHHKQLMIKQVDWSGYCPFPDTTDDIYNMVNHEINFNWCKND